MPDGIEESREWMRKAAVSDIGGVTDAEERVEEEAGLAFTEEEFERRGRQHDGRVTSDSGQEPASARLSSQRTMPLTLAPTPDSSSNLSTRASSS